MNRYLRDALILALIPLAVIAFSLFEWCGITSAPWHTISFYAQQYRWLQAVIAILPVVALVIFEWWWLFHHLNLPIPRLPG